MTNDIGEPKVANKRYYSLQAFRGLAAMCVVFYHLGVLFADDKYFKDRSFNDYLFWGNIGVYFFFVLSGFIITKVHIRELGKPEHLYKYLWKRFSRVFPIYWFVFVLVFFSNILVSNREYPSLNVLLKSLLLIPQNPVIVGGHGAPVIGVAWTLHYEMTFYLLFAVAIANKIAGAFFSMTLVLGTILCGSKCGFPFSFYFNPLIFLFFGGAIVAVVPKMILRESAAHRLILATSVFVIASVVLYEIMLGSRLGEVERISIYGPIFMFLIWIAVSGEERFGRILKNRYLQLSGDASYSLYLSHFSVIGISCKILKRMEVNSVVPLAILFFILFFVCLSFGYLLHVLVEKPILKYLAEMNPFKGLTQDRNKT